jgi:hypothetical protein
MKSFEKPFEPSSGWSEHRYVDGAEPVGEAGHQRDFWSYDHQMWSFQLRQGDQPFDIVSSDILAAGQHGDARIPGGNHDIRDAGALF